jgi:hypothetical protein
MLTEEQFKRARQLLADKQELQRLADRFSSAGLTMGLCFTYGNNGSIAKDDSAPRFNNIKRGLIRQLNALVMEELRGDIARIDAQLAEHVTPDA